MNASVPNGPPAPDGAVAVEAPGAACIEVLRAGPMSSIQDGGRFGLRALGVTVAGAADTLSLALGNLLVGNARDAAAIEITLPPVRLRFLRTTRIALTGAELDAEIEGVGRVLAWWSYPIEAGQVLVLRPSAAAAGLGLHAYLSVAGGIAVPPVLGSRSTDLKSGFGGFHGRLLANGDVLPLVAERLVGAAGARNADGVPLGRSFGIRSPSWFWPRREFGDPEASVGGGGGGVLAGTGAARPVEIRFIAGPEWDDFSLVSRRLLENEDWEVSPRSNRMGYRLSGPVLQRLKPRMRDLLSHGVLPGVIQVPPDGQPIVLLADAQTTGGYPKIGVVISADVPIMAQVRFGAKVRFVRVELEEARQALRDVGAYLDDVESVIARRLSAAT